MNILSTHHSLQKIKPIHKQDNYETSRSVSLETKQTTCLGNNDQPKSPITVSSVDELTSISQEKTECLHNIVDDYIDITPDRSMKIKYCDICMVTFFD